ncbi:hypothetical protein FISHEDRAFT_66328 [Fistulina hepatica ATCC 64428]|uniref:Queuosine 5'-phosphate N-glycosylase/hydrolase n=1 Tax=Fistulina hepatica ATCC 64428 TaxID=1128425 RepID=A0A0D7A9V6_9AGAR|nr:hypothetical protein FISHEDRAFT_66328 [Fistulina hepatica ATCC 64428]
MAHGIPLVKTESPHVDNSTSASSFLENVGAGNIHKNPVVSSALYAYHKTNLVQINETGVRLAAHHILQKMRTDMYSPHSWRSHPLHMCPNGDAARDKAVLDWIFLVSSLNFSFWSVLEGRPERYGVTWQESWSSDMPKTFTGYWSLVAALNRALSEGIPITDPQFYSSVEQCPDSLIEYVFRPAEQCSEDIPLLRERIAIMREVGLILTQNFGGAYFSFIEEFQRRTSGKGTALQLVQFVTDTFPSFRDEHHFAGRKIYIWKRAQIMVSETWAAFYPERIDEPHPIFPGAAGPAIGDLTMFADYRVPQILAHLRILDYPPSLMCLLREGTPLASGSREELSLRAASIVAVERVRDEMVNSVLVDFYLWDLAKRVESGQEKIEGLQTAELVPIHRTRSIWY